MTLQYIIKKKRTKVAFLATWTHLFPNVKRFFFGRPYTSKDFYAPPHNIFSFFEDHNILYHPNVWNCLFSPISILPIFFLPKYIHPNIYTVILVFLWRASLKKKCHFCSAGNSISLVLNRMHFILYPPIFGFWVFSIKLHIFWDIVSKEC